MKKRIISLIIVAVLAVGMSLNAVNVYSDNYISSVDTEEGLSYLSELENIPLEEVQKKVDEAENTRKEADTKELAELELKKAVEKSIKLIKKGKKTYKKVFTNACFAGDSLMAGLEAYNILSSKKIISKVSASLSHLEENIDKITALSPQMLFLHYGINMIAVEDVYLNNFISKYTSLIKELQKNLPNTRIIVSLIFPVDRTIAKAKRFGAVDKYNKRLIKMCNKLKIEYLDSSSVLNSHKECYGSDGIHQSKAFYEKYWLKFIMREKGIY